jgi:hypothetical protein
LARAIDLLPSLCRVSSLVLLWSAVFARRTNSKRQLFGYRGITMLGFLIQYKVAGLTYHPAQNDLVHSLEG